MPGLLDSSCMPKDVVSDLHALTASPAIELPDLLDAVLDAAIRLTASDVGGAIFIPNAETGRLFWSFKSVDGTLKQPPKKLAGDWESRLHRFPTESTNGHAIRTRTTPDEDGSLSLFRECRSLACVPLLRREPAAGKLQVEAADAHAYSEDQMFALAELAYCASRLIGRLLLRDHAANRGFDIHFVGHSPRILGLEEQIERIARDPKSPVLIRGERGSGKELAAYAIHYHGSRRIKPFVPANSAAFTSTLAADELFGHARGAFTGAHDGREGLFQQAQGGTLFLDEIGDLPADVQASLLRVLDHGEIRKIGCDRAFRTDVRVIAATNKDLEAMTEKGTFRSDLYDRLNVFQVQVPPLRERVEDIPLLFDFFLRKACLVNGRCGRMEEQRTCRACLGLGGRACTHPAVYERLRHAEFPGNVRELRNLVFRLAATVAEDELLPSHLPPRYQTHGNGRCKDLDCLRLDRFIAGHIEGVLEKTGGNKSEAARLLGLPLTTLVNKMKKLEIA